MRPILKSTNQRYPSADSLRPKRTGGTYMVRFSGRQPSGSVISVWPPPASGPGTAAFRSPATTTTPTSISPSPVPAQSTRKNKARNQSPSKPPPKLRIGRLMSTRSKTSSSQLTTAERLERVRSKREQERLEAQKSIEISMSRIQRAEENRARAIKERSVSAHSAASKVEMARQRKAEMEIAFGSTAERDLAYLGVPKKYAALNAPLK
ncbi:unnamed protein product [Sphagnum balticum]